MTKAYEIPGFRFTETSHGDIKQFAGVKITSNGVEQADAEEKIDGIAQMPADSDKNEAITIMYGGISFAVASESISKGDEVEVAADGKFATQDSGETVGKAMVEAGGDGEEFCVLIY